MVSHLFNTDNGFGKDLLSCSCQIIVLQKERAHSI